MGVIGSWYKRWCWRRKSRALTDRMKTTHFICTTPDSHFWILVPGHQFLPLPQIPTRKSFVVTQNKFFPREFLGVYWYFFCFMPRTNCRWRVKSFLALCLEALSKVGRSSKTHCWCCVHGVQRNILSFTLSNTVRRRWCHKPRRCHGQAELTAVKVDWVHAGSRDRLCQPSCKANWDSPIYFLVQNVHCKFSSFIFLRIASWKLNFIHDRINALMRKRFSAGWMTSSNVQCCVFGSQESSGSNPIFRK